MKEVFNVGSKVCTVCRRDKPLNDYYSYNKKKKDGEEYVYFQPHCKECASIKAQAREFSIEERKKRSAKWRSKPENKEANLLHKKRYRDSGKYRNWQQENKDKIKKYQSIRANKKHDITKEEWDECLLFFDTCCAYCGITEEIAITKYKNRLHKDHVEHKGSNGIDNCVPACKRCNSSKHIYELSMWYTTEKEFYREERLSKIIEWLNYNK